ncbi:hypothetical protein [Macrococcoides caseolyticum]|uniref:hypothetical protein n=1 Tax=Macrococcoides caseolyticum TaxID=69966 RepID=UPI000C346B5C|nr:hypothetical protein [Macrococcus caseolyticus]PKE16021.1 hypothetical protein CW718_11845 [Macrococcus caseolyticus]PKE67428.1 hypothetical protein CW663_08195 [Macrococcus caseolyticus]
MSFKKLKQNNPLLVMLGVLTGLLISLMYFIINNSDNPTDSLIKLLTPLSTISVAILVYIYTTDNNRKQLLNSLDEKSGWRKSLFELAGKENIKEQDIHILRSSLRFTPKNKPKTYFDIMSKIIIIYCDGVSSKSAASDKYFSLTYSSCISFTTKFDARIVRLFSRYLLADHWEKNQLDDNEKKKYEKKEEIDIKTLNTFINKNQITSKLEKNERSKYKYIQKENELFIFTLKEFKRISDEISKSPDS